MEYLRMKVIKINCLRNKIISAYIGMCFLSFILLFMVSCNDNAPIERNKFKYKSIFYSEFNPLFLEKDTFPISAFYFKIDSANTVIAQMSYEGEVRKYMEKQFPDSLVSALNLLVEAALNESNLNLRESSNDSIEESFYCGRPRVLKVVNQNNEKSFGYFSHKPRCTAFDSLSAWIYDHTFENTMQIKSVSFHSDWKETWDSAIIIKKYVTPELKSVKFTPPVTSD